jgi:L-ascorbate metabolism protein UlaG (beta-lactamase superfamily)
MTVALDRDTTFTWNGHSAFEIRSPGGKAIVLDPFLVNPNSPKTAAQVEACDVMLVTHGHFDHMGEAVSIAARFRPVWPCIHEMSLWLARQLPGGADAAIGMNKGGTVETAGIKFTMVHADHSAGDWNAGGETTLYLGDPVGFVVEFENGFRAYLAGDTDVYGDMGYIRELYAPELALLPIGGHYTMGPRGAAIAAELLGVQHIIPIHYGTFPILAGTPDQLRSELAARGLSNVQVHSPAPGETVS